MYGTIRYIDLDGGYWAIEGEDGQFYDAFGGLASDVQIDGLAVWFAARLRPDLPPAHSLTIVVEIVRIVVQ